MSASLEMVEFPLGASRLLCSAEDPGVTAVERMASASTPVPILASPPGGPGPEAARALTAMMLDSVGIVSASGVDPSSVKASCSGTLGKLPPAEDDDP